MADLNKKKEDIESESGESGSGSKGSQAKIHLPGMDSLRTDQLPPGELKRLLVILDQTSKVRIDVQKKTSAEYEARKKADLSQTDSFEHTHQFGQGRGSSGSGSWPFKAHPFLSASPAYQGIDKKITPLIPNSEQNTNNDLQNKLEHQLQNQKQFQNRLENSKKFIPPTPRPY